MSNNEQERLASTIRGEPAVYVICGTYTKEELKELKTRLGKNKWDTSKIFKAIGGRLTFYYSKDVKFND